MDEWRRKVEEMKRLRGGNSNDSNSSSTSSTEQKSATLPTTTSTASTSSPSTPKTNPFLAKAASVVNLVRPSSSTTATKEEPISIGSPVLVATSNPSATVTSSSTTTTTTNNRPTRPTGSSTQQDNKYATLPANLKPRGAMTVNPFLLKMQQQKEESKTAPTTNNNTTSNVTSSTTTTPSTASPTSTSYRSANTSSSPLVSRANYASTNSNSSATAPNPTTVTNTTSNVTSSYNTSPTMQRNASSSSLTSTQDVGSSLYKVKYEQEAKRRAELEKMYDEKVKEINQLKVDLRKARMPGGSTTATSVPQRNINRQTKRMTQRQTQRMSVHIVNSLDSVLKQIGGLDAHIRASEASRMQAEDKLMEIAIAKLEVDEIVQKVDNVLKEIIGKIESFNNQQIKEMLQKIRTQTASEEEGGQSKAACRFSIMIPKDGLKLDQVQNAPAPPPPSANFNSSSGGSAPAKLSLLDQIRQGKTLKNIDISKLKEEQQEYRAKAKEVMGNMRSLEDVLRGALATRVLDMNLYDEDEEEEETWS